MTPYLSRRDAIVALGAAGVATAGLGALAWDTLDADGEGPPPERETIEAVAEALYPTQVTGIDEFVETYVVGRVRDREEYLDGMFAAARELDDHAQYWYDEPYADLDRETRQQIFDEYGLADADPDPEGNDVERVRYYLLNELLYALYSSPTGGSLVGLENPQGHPGGTESYQRGPRD